jgi:DNA-binding NarL/FixJ family response regulator
LNKIRVLIAEDHAIVREGIRGLLALEPDIEVVGEAINGRQAVQMCKTLAPDIVTMDIAMPVLGGLDATRQITSAELPTKVLVLSKHSEDRLVHSLTAAGAVGYLVKQSLANDLPRAIRNAHQGNAFFSPLISKRLLDSYRKAYLKGAAIKHHREQLTPREMEVLLFLAEGKMISQIAADLRLTISTVGRHRRNLMNKLNVHNTNGLKRFACARGILSVSRRVASGS